jgi:hypothetical protein
MPSTSKKQHNFMAAVANNPSFAKKVGVPQSVGKDFNQADKGRKFSKGGDMKKMNMGGYAGGGMPMKDGKPAFVGDGKGKMAKGGIASSLKAHAAAPASKAHGMKSGGMAPSKMGSVKTSATRDGIASKGKTKGKMIKMNMGGRAC